MERIGGAPDKGKAEEIQTSRPNNTDFFNVPILADWEKMNRNIKVSVSSGPPSFFNIAKKLLGTGGKAVEGAVW